MKDLRNVSSANAMPGMSSRATLCEYGQVTVGPSPRGGFLAGPRLSLNTSEGRDVNSVLGVPALAEGVGAEEASVNGEGGAAWPFRLRA